MLTSIQFPLADSRAFVDGDVGLLTRPTWPSVFPDYDFVRFFGPVRRRRLGGFAGWIAEHAICHANKALRFHTQPKITFQNSTYHISSSIPFRRFYFDGLAVGKFEVGIATIRNGTTTVENDDARALIYSYLNLPVDIPIPGEKISCRLIQATNPLSRLYQIASTSTSRIPQIKSEPWWVRPGPPVMCLIIEPAERVELPFRPNRVITQQALGFELSHYLIRHEGKHIPMWVFRLNKSSKLEAARILRICLLRLHAENECLKLVLQNLLSGKLTLNVGTTASETLQRYLSEATKRISRLGTQSENLCDVQLAEVARTSEDMIHPGQREAMLEALETIRIRRTVLQRVKEYVNQTVQIQEQIMGDNYNVTQAGAVGPGARVSGSEFTQQLAQGEGRDLSKLAEELRSLRAALLTNATAAEEYAAIGAVASAEIAAVEHDEPTTLKYLSQAGKWALDTATKIGTTIAAAALKESLGIK